MDLKEVFSRYENKLVEQLRRAMLYGQNELIREYAGKVIEYHKIFIEEVR